MADPLVVLLANEFREELIARQQASILEMSRAWLQIEKAISAEMEALAEELTAIREAGGTISRDLLLGMDRYRSLQAQVLLQIAQYNEFAAETIATGQEGNALAGLDDAAAMIDAVGEMNEVGNLAFARLRSEAVENIVAIARGGMPLETLLRSIAPQSVEGMTSLLIEGMSIGRGPRDTAQLAISRGLSIGLNQALLIARDQQNRAYRQASIQQYRESGVVVGYKRLAAKNERTCPACLALDGQRVPTAELPPLHPQDRCTVVPIVTNLPEVEFETGEDWFRKQPPDLQRQMLGPGRYEVWRQGKFKFGDLAKVGNDPTWGPTVGVRSLKELV